MSYPTNEEIRATAYAMDTMSYAQREKVIKSYIIRTRIEEADGFDHGDEAWSGNMEDDEAQSDSPVHNYTERLKRELEQQ